MDALFRMVRGWFKQPEPCPPHRWLRQGDGLVCDKCARKPGSWF